MTRRMPSIRRLYGASPLHLILSIACLAFAGYLVWTVVPAPNSARIFIWIGLAAAVHDLLLWPLYVLLDRVLAVVHNNRKQAHALVPWINHLRVPAVLSAIALVISFPLVLRHSEPAYRTATGLTERPYLGRWLLLSVSAFVASALLYVMRLLRKRQRQASK
jgi:hypothetical protein